MESEITATRREQGPPTSCHQCGEGPILGFDVVDTDHGVHRVLCTDCAMCAVQGDAEQAQEQSPQEHPCDKCGEAVAVDEFHGRDRPDGSSEYLCSECPSDYSAEGGAA